MRRSGTGRLQVAREFPGTFWAFLSSLFWSPRRGNPKLIIELALTIDLYILGYESRFRNGQKCDEITLAIFVVWNLIEVGDMLAFS